MTDGTDATPGAPQQTRQAGADAEGAGVPAEASACPHPEAIGQRWGDPISAEWQAELQTLGDEWEVPGADHGEFRGPFHGTADELTGADVAWLVKQVRDHFDFVPDLHLEGANLYAAHLEQALLSLAHLETLYVNPSVPILAQASELNPDEPPSGRN
jgi:hypothetical protein